MKFLLFMTIASLTWTFSFESTQAQINELSSTEHKLQIKGNRTVRYTAYAGRVPIRDGETDEVRAYMFFVAYRVPSTGAPRPVTFLWNGGPGSNTSTLHFESVGPKRFDTNHQLIDNADTALTYTDLVFVDAIGTGYSRLTGREYGQEFYQTKGDVASFTDFVRAWRLLFNAVDAPLYIAGESWGSYRAVAVAQGLETRSIHVNGLILISGRTGLPTGGSDDEFAELQIVHMPAIALHHGKLSPTLGKDVSTIEQQVSTWARETYLPALDRIQSLTGQERDEVAEKLSLYSGLSIDQIDRSTLVITPRQFLQGLLREEEETLNTFDMRLVNGEQPSSNGRLDTVQAYFRKQLEWITDRVYIGAVTDGYAPNDVPLRRVGGKWDYTIGYYSNPMSPEATKAANMVAIDRGYPPGGQDIPLTVEAMELNPNMRVLIINGRHDSLRSCASTAEILRRLDDEVLRSRITFKCYNGGHAYYRDAETRRNFNADIRALQQPTTREH